MKRRDFLRDTAIAGTALVVLREFPQRFNFASIEPPPRTQEYTAVVSSAGAITWRVGRVATPHGHAVLGYATVTMPDNLAVKFVAVTAP